MKWDEERKFSYPTCPTPFKFFIKKGIRISLYKDNSFQLVSLLFLFKCPYFLHHIYPPQKPTLNINTKQI